MIFKDEELFITDAVLSVIDVANECILVDSGSKDKSLEKVTALKNQHPAKIKIFSREWPNSFSDQKNYAISQATSEWILFLDADERISKDDHKNLREALKKENIAAYLLPIRNYTRHFQQIGFQWDNENPWAPGYYLTYLHRLFRRDPKIRYEGIIHERIEPSLESISAKTESLDIPIHHLGPLKEEDLGLQEKRYSFYEKLAVQKITDDPKNAQAHWELGVILQKRNQPQRALEKFKTAHELVPEEELYEIYYFMTLFHLRNWKALETTSAHFHRSQFFITVAEAQRDKSKITEIEKFEKDFVQAPLIGLELALIHQQQELVQKYRRSAMKSFDKTGWPQMIEGSYLRQINDFENALSLLEEAHKNNCKAAALELGIVLTKLNRTKKVVELFKSIETQRKLTTDEISVLKYAELQSQSKN